MIGDFFFPADVPKKANDVDDVCVDRIEDGSGFVVAGAKPMVAPAAAERMRAAAFIVSRMCRIGM